MALRIIPYCSYIKTLKQILKCHCYWSSKTGIRKIRVILAKPLLPETIFNCWDFWNWDEYQNCKKPCLRLYSFLLFAVCEDIYSSEICAVKMFVKVLFEKTWYISDWEWRWLLGECVISSSAAGEGLWEHNMLSYVDLWRPQPICSI